MPLYYINPFDSEFYSSVIKFCCNRYFICTIKTKTPLN